MLWLVSWRTLLFVSEDDEEDSELIIRRSRCTAFESHLGVPRGL